MDVVDLQQMVKVYLSVECSDDGHALECSNKGAYGMPTPDGEPRPHQPCALEDDAISLRHRDCPCRSAG